ncbi:hypothetical protein H8N03_07785 [Ramlibacter sp. USB13]|uniref:Uncharacterized protein n=1 Tax=Ramlibacter cellulosilyticus TaxID=2764187 RepID=A0A923SAJ6_9BURK|nr:hypothetical protein [Ramlibacter cellulosilyticus]MBC5782844.1 hypothetical protein [Ramlibacter cellulosilyticus]
MKASLFLLAAAAAFAAPAFAQPDAQCIVAGRLSDGLWAPKHGTIHLFDGDGRPVATPTKAALANVRRATLDEPALLSKCDGNNTLFNADNEPPGRKTEVPALARGTVEVESVAYPKLQVGGELVELRVRVPAERVVMMTR